jgi:hypothetical protein
LKNYGFRISGALVLLLLSAAATPLGLAHAQTGPVAFKGTFGDTSFGILGAEIVNGNTVFFAKGAGAVHGGFTGTYSFVANITMLPSGYADYHAIDVCQCTVAGKQGVATFDELGAGAPEGSFSSSEVITSATGGLSGLTGTATLQGRQDPLTMLTSGTWVASLALPYAYGSIRATFNSQTIQPGSQVWFVGAFDLQSAVPPSGLTVYVVDQTITLQLQNKVAVELSVPDSVLTFSTSATSATTAFDKVDDRWVTTVPAASTNGVFFSGLAYLVPPGVSVAGATVTWSGFFLGPSGFKAQWQFASAAYTTFSADYNSLGVKPLHSTSLDSYHNGDQPGTPENFKSYLAPGAMGGGGSNYIGGYSATGSVAYAP